MATKVYQSGLLPPTMGGELVRQQMRLGHRYGNELIYFARARRAAVREAEPPELQPLVVNTKEAEERAYELAVQIKKRRAAVGRAPGPLAPEEARRNRAEGKEAQQKLRGLRAVARDLREKLRDARKAVAPLLAPVREIIHERWLQLLRGPEPHSNQGLRGEYSQHGQGLRHGMYTAIEESVNQACGPLWDGTEPNDPRFRRWKGEGMFAVQIQGGCPLGLLDTHTTIQIDRTPDLSVRSGGLRDPNRKIPKKAAEWCRLRLRVGTDQKTRKPIWAEWPMTMHRPLPEGSVITQAQVHLRRIGPREIWTAEITVRLPDDWKPEPCGKGVVCVRLGWEKIGREAVKVRRRGKSVTVHEVPIIKSADWFSEDDFGQLSVPARLVERIEHARSIRAIRDSNQNEMRNNLLAWLDEQPEWPEWMPTKQHLVKWESPARWVSLARQWSTRRWDGDSPGYEPLQAWCAQDRHLWEWEAFEDRRARRWRKDFYRKFAAHLARRFEIVVMPKIKWSEIARKGLLQNPSRNIDSHDDGQDLPKAVRDRRTTASPGELQECIKQAFESRGGRVVFVPLTNLLDGGDEVDGGDMALLKAGIVARDTPVVVQKKEPRWAKVRRKRTEKETRGIGKPIDPPPMTTDL